MTLLFSCGNLVGKFTSLWQNLSLGASFRMRVSELTGVLGRSRRPRLEKAVISAFICTTRPCPVLTLGGERSHAREIAGWSLLKT